MADEVLRCIHPTTQERHTTCHTAGEPRTRPPSKQANRTSDSWTADPVHHRYSTHIVGRLVIALSSAALVVQQAIST